MPTGVAKMVGGWTLILLGVAGLFVPFVPGTALLKGRAKTKDWQA